MSKKSWKTNGEKYWKVELKGGQGLNMYYKNTQNGYILSKDTHHILYLWYKGGKDHKKYNA